MTKLDDKISEIRSRILNTECKQSYYITGFNSYSKKTAIIFDVNPHAFHTKSTITIKISVDGQNNGN